MELSACWAIRNAPCLPVFYGWPLLFRFPFNDMGFSFPGIWHAEQLGMLPVHCSVAFELVTASNAHSPRMCGGSLLKAIYLSFGTDQPVQNLPRQTLVAPVGGDNDTPQVFSSCNSYRTAAAGQMTPLLPLLKCIWQHCWRGSFWCQACRGHKSHFIKRISYQTLKFFWRMEHLQISSCSSKPWRAAWQYQEQHFLLFLESNGRGVYPETPKGLGGHDSHEEESHLFFLFFPNGLLQRFS